MVVHIVAAIPLGLVVSQPDTLLSSMRKEIERLYCKQAEFGPRFLAENWCFLDSEYERKGRFDVTRVHPQWRLAVRRIQIDYTAFNQTKRRF